MQSKLEPVNEHTLADTRGRRPASNALHACATALSWKKKLFFALVTTATFCVILYCVRVFRQSGSVYDHVQHRRWTGYAYSQDDKYGNYPKPNILAYHSLRDGEQVPVIFDERGFRVPVVSQKASGAKPDQEKMLFLGCSFTHGYGVPAEKSFSYLAAEELGFEPLNAGGSGWGLCQMVMRAREAIPQQKPKYVVVQYSPWLARRSQCFYRPTNEAILPAPYFYESHAQVSIHPLVFKGFDLKHVDYSEVGFLLFVARVGLPLAVHDDYYRMATHLRHAAGLLPKPLADRQAAVDFAYREIQRLCDEHAAQMLVVKLYRNGFTDPQPDRLERLECPVIDTLDPMVSELPQKSREAWERHYVFWRGTPPQLVDHHPNTKAHEMIAGAIVNSF